MKVSILLLLTIGLVGMMPLFTFGVPQEGDRAKNWKNNYKTDERLLNKMNERLARESKTVVRSMACESQGPEVRQSTTLLKGTTRLSSVSCPCSCAGKKAMCGEHRAGLACAVSTDKCDRYIPFFRSCSCVAKCEFA